MMRPPRALTACLLLLLLADKMHARPPPRAATNGTADDAPPPQRNDARIAVAANEQFGGTAPRPLLQRLRELGGGGGDDSDVVDDSTVRSERSTNLSHITGTSRKIQIYIKNRHLQLMPDGAVNGTNDDASDYSKYTPKTLSYNEKFKFLSLFRFRKNCISSNCATH